MWQELNITAGYYDCKRKVIKVAVEERWSLAKNRHRISPLFEMIHNVNKCEITNETEKGRQATPFLSLHR